MKTIKELAPTWTKVTKERGMIPMTNVQVDLNGYSAGMGNPNSCFVGEARGGGCYYDKNVERKIGRWFRKDKIVKVPNPKYCEKCMEKSMDLYNLVGGKRGDLVSRRKSGVKTMYEELCRKYEKHYDKAHNGDKC